MNTFALSLIKAKCKRVISAIIKRNTINKQQYNKIGWRPEVPASI